MLQVSRDDQKRSTHEVQLDAATIEAIARRVVELLSETSRADTATLLSAEQVAKQFGVSRAWVYENANRLGAIRIGEGSRPRLRFDSDEVARCMSSAARQPADAPAPREHALGRSDLIPIRGL